jgi:hypothetical protein
MELKNAMTKRKIMKTAHSVPDSSLTMVSISYDLNFSFKCIHKTETTSSFNMAMHI